MKIKKYFRKMRKVSNDMVSLSLTAVEVVNSLTESDSTGELDSGKPVKQFLRLHCSLIAPKGNMIHK